MGLQPLKSEKQVAIDREPETHKLLLVDAVRVHNYHNGVVGIEVPCAEPSEQDRAALHRMFPNLTDRAYRMPAHWADSAVATA